MRVSFRRIDSRETIQPWRGGKPETAENDAATLAAARPVHRFSETVYQPVPNPDGPVILVPSLG